MSVVDWIKLKASSMSIETPVQQYSDLNLFIDLVEGLEQHRNVTTVNEFLNMIKNKNRSSVTGSAVLAKRTGKLETAVDIDIFIDNRDGTANQILKTFFSKTIIENVIWPIYESKMVHLEDRRDFVSDGMLIQTNSERYDFNIQGYSLDTYKIRLGNHMILNFILLKHPKDMRPTEDEDNYFFKMEGAVYPFTGQLLNQFIDKDRLYQLAPVAQYSTYIIEYISRHFDFQELKYTYDFDTKTFRNIYDTALEINERMIDKLTTIESDHLIDTSMQRALRSKKLLEIDLIDFNESYNDPNNVTVSGRNNQRFERYDIITDYADVNEVMESHQLPRIAEDFAALTGRIKKYKKKGFVIKDPTRILLNLHGAMALAVIGVSLDPDFDTIERQAIFDSNSSSKKRYQFLNRLKNLFTNNKEELGIETEDDSDPAPDDVKQDTL